MLCAVEGEWSAARVAHETSRKHKIDKGRRATRAKKEIKRKAKERFAGRKMSEEGVNDGNSLQWKLCHGCGVQRWCYCCRVCKIGWCCCASCEEEDSDTHSDTCKAVVKQKVLIANQSIQILKLEEEVKHNKRRRQSQGKRQRVAVKSCGGPAPQLWPGSRT